MMITPLFSFAECYRSYFSGKRKGKIQYWRGFWSIIGLEDAWILESCGHRWRNQDFSAMFS